MQIATNQLLILRRNDIGVINENFPSFQDKLTIFKSFLNVSSTYLSMKFFRFLEDAPVELQLRKSLLNLNDSADVSWVHTGDVIVQPREAVHTTLLMATACFWRFSVVFYLGYHFQGFLLTGHCTSISQRPLDGGCHRRVNDLVDVRGKYVSVSRDKVFPKLRIGETDNNSLGETASWEPPFKVLLFRTLSSVGRDSLWIVSCSLLSSACSCPVLLVSYRAHRSAGPFVHFHPSSPNLSFLE